MWRWEAIIFLRSRGVLTLKIRLVIWPKRWLFIWTDYETVVTQSITQPIYLSWKRKQDNMWWRLGHSTYSYALLASNLRAIAKFFFSFSLLERVHISWFIMILSEMRRPILNALYSWSISKFIKGFNLKVWSLEIILYVTLHNPIGLWSLMDLTCLTLGMREMIVWLYFFTISPHIKKLWTTLQISSETTYQYFWKKKPVRSFSPRALLGSIEKVVGRIPITRLEPFNARFLGPILFLSPVFSC